MSDILTQSVGILGGLGLLASIFLFVVSKAFYVYEDPKIALVEDILPTANCGGCGSPGCSAFAEKLVKTDDISDLFCPVGGNDTMQEIAQLLGKEIKEKPPMVAVVRCQGNCEVRPHTTKYEGPMSCAIEAMIYGGETDCQFGCLGNGDCVDVCLFDAIYMDEENEIPIVISDKCTACNACVEACPRDIIELRPKNKKDLKIFVSCVNHDVAGAARKSCQNACIACGKCLEVCPKEAIDITDNLAYINPVSCTLCRKCVDVCPTGAIVATNFPVKKVKVNA